VPDITLPNAWNPRPHQRALWAHLEGGGKRAVAVWHRRAGKDSTAINWTAVAAHQRIGTYWHMLPTATQGRRVVWEGRDAAGRRLIDQAFPPELRCNTRNDRMSMELKCGSVWQVVGSDNYDRLVGANPVGVVFSEWSLTDPRAWDYVRPILAENGGWAMFIYTPRGKNHGFDLYDLAHHHGDWFAEKLTVEDTGILAPAVIAAERSSGMSEALIQQEYFCSFEAANEGSYYGKLLEQAEQSGRVTRVPWQPELQVDTWWDLGIGDSTAIWFSQQAGLERHIIDYYECSGEGLAHYAKVLQDRNYIYMGRIGRPTTSWPGNWARANPGWRWRRASGSSSGWRRGSPSRTGSRRCATCCRGPGSMRNAVGRAYGPCAATTGISMSGARPIYPIQYMTGLRMRRMRSAPAR
jgi:phage terminase large subunit